MKKVVSCSVMLWVFLLYSTATFAEEMQQAKGGPDWLYIKAKKKPPRHVQYDEELKCKDCHLYNGVDAYSTATMSLKKSKTGVLPRKELEERIAEIVAGKGDHRQIYILSTSYENKPLASVVEFVLDPQTLNFYSFSEKQGEKLFHIAANPNVSIEYVKQLEDHAYFKQPLCLQVVGKAKLLRGTDPDYEEGMNIYLPTLPIQLTPERIAGIKKTKIITKITPERIVIRDFTMPAKGYRMVQIWEREDKK